MHLPLGDSTLNILSEERLRLMKQTVVLVNILRGRLIDQFFLKKMFMAKCLANTAFDVLKTQYPTCQTFIATFHLSVSVERVIFVIGLSSIIGMKENYTPLIDIPQI